MKRKAIIISLSSTKLTNQEKNLFIKNTPWGVILFERNINSFSQTKNLINSIKKITKDKKYPVLIDEEGGTVTRLKNIFDNKPYSQRFFGKLYEIDKKSSISLYVNYINSMCSFLKKIGININTVPVLDILKKNTHKIIGNRSFSDKLSTINKLSKICINTYTKNKIATVIKHIPGHGSASDDSHKKLPFVRSPYKDLIKSDFACFKNSKSFFAMTAHIVYSKIDKNNVCTHSSYLIKKIIRNKLKFKGLIISDDISMKALKDDLITNAKKSLLAGCNLTLYCAGNYKDSYNLLKEMPFIDKFTVKKTSELYSFLR
jgi:beta-N-acetylhexosaminidase